MSTTRKYYNALPSDVMLEEYKIIHVLGSGGFGVAYLAIDTQLDNYVVIKEYLPRELAVRDQETHHILPKDPQSTQDYEWGLKEYLNEARTIAKFDHPNIVKVKKYIEANNTAYIVMNHVQGTSLDELASDQTATQEEIDELLSPILEGLAAVHDLGYLHRDIKPANILIQDETHRPILIDFGAARYLLGKHSKSVSAFITAGYSPYEQYHSQGNQGAWTDIYAMGAVLYRLVSGKDPVESISRLAETSNGRPDPLLPITQVAKGNYSKSLLAAIDHALELQDNKRPQNVREWQVELSDKKKERGSDHGHDKKDTQRHYGEFGIAIVSLVVALSVSAYYFMPSLFEKKQDNKRLLVEKSAENKTSAIASSSPSSIVKQIPTNYPPVANTLPKVVIDKPIVADKSKDKPVINQSKSPKIAKESKKIGAKKSPKKTVKKTKPTMSGKTKKDKAATIGITTEQARRIASGISSSSKNNNRRPAQRPPLGNNQRNKVQAQIQAQRRQQQQKEEDNETCNQGGASGC